ncbi:Hypp5902 [Branchiostoma lanceolatum]|uniref:Hypp5902 protein n=1 Tax=Branchiostoma lanceolatum TaxID=7740 RepID=A0A8J9YPC9_BRALA|nr:Hypp5902 [Branchiostoma lanceolatum]
MAVTRACVLGMLSTVMCEVAVLLLLTPLVTDAAVGTVLPNRTCNLLPSPARSSLSQRVYGADIVAYGRIVEKIPQEGQDSVYKAKLDVYCVLKGGALPPSVTVSYLGNVTACSRTQVAVQTRYVLFLRNPRNGLFIPHEVNLQNAAIPADNATLAAVVKVCGIHPELPKGVDRYTQVEDCGNIGARAPDDQCISPMGSSGQVYRIYTVWMFILVVAAVKL